MPLAKLSTSVFTRTSEHTRALNLAIDAYNKAPNSIALGKVEALIARPGRAHWASRGAEIVRLEIAIKQEHAKFATGASADVLGKRAEVNLNPTTWVEKLFPDAPSLEGAQRQSDGKQGAQGNTHKFTLPGGRKLFAKTARGKDKASEVTEVQREYDVYKKLYAAAGEHPNLVKVWGWADLQLGVQHEFGFIMEHIDGFDGRTVQAMLKEHWDLGIITSAEYWSSIQYVGRCHIEVIQHLRAAGWAHNDIKPENYVVDKTTGEVIVIDLGGAGRIGERWNAVTTEYLAPEMLAGKHANRDAVGTAAADVFALGASIAHAAEAAHAFHVVARPNRGLAKTEAPSLELAAPVDGIAAGRYKNPFQYGADTAYTKQLKRMMNTSPLERDKTLDERASNAFFYDSILNDEQARKVLKGVVSGSSRSAWSMKWVAAGKQVPTLITVDRLTLETKLRDRMRKHQGTVNYGGIGVVETMSHSEANLKKLDLQTKRKDLEDIVKMIHQANAFGIDTTKDRKIINDKLKECDRADRVIAAALARPAVPAAAAAGRKR